MNMSNRMKFLFVIIILAVISSITIFLVYKNATTKLLYTDYSESAKASLTGICEINAIGWKQNILAAKNRNGKNVFKIKLPNSIDNVIISEDHRRILITTIDSSIDRYIRILYLYDISVSQLKKILYNAENISSIAEWTSYLVFAQYTKIRTQSKIKYNKVVIYSKKNLEQKYIATGNIADVTNSQKWSEFAIEDYSKDEFGDIDRCNLKAFDIDTKRTWNIVSNRRQIQHKWIAPSLIAYVVKDKYEHLSIHQYNLSTSKDTLLVANLDVPKIQLDRYDALSAKLYYTVSYREFNNDPRIDTKWYVSIGSKPQRQELPTASIKISPMIPSFLGVKGAAK